ncbi:MAG: glycogen synthase GlgA [bacterium]
MNILFASAEVSPFAKVGGLADVVGSLPRALNRHGHDARVIMPNYQRVEEKFKPSMLLTDIPVQLGGQKTTVNLKYLEHGGLKIYLVDCPHFFMREEVYMYQDDGERFITFCKGALEALRRLDWKPDIIHANDWQTGLIPCLIKTTLKNDPLFGGIGTVYTIHNLAYQGLFPPDYMIVAGVDWSEFTFEKLEFFGQLNLMKAGIVYSDQVNTVSDKYKDEIQTEEYGCGLDGLLRAQSHKLSGIINGIDTQVFNPATDKNIFVKYTADKLSGKEENKGRLLKELGLPYKKTKRVPLIGMITRLAAQKGFDILEEIIEKVMKCDVQFVLLGTGDDYYEKLMGEVSKKHPDKASINLKFDAALAQKIYAACDIFLMPSRYEPCGLGQLISLRYGTVPVVRYTGGLADTIEDYNARRKKGTGFVFENYTGADFFKAVKRALKCYDDKKVWTQIVKEAMSRDFSWEASAKKYEEIYRKAIM